MKELSGYPLPDTIRYMHDLIAQCRNLRSLAMISTRSFCQTPTQLRYKVNMIPMIIKWGAYE